MRVHGRPVLTQKIVFFSFQSHRDVVSRAGQFPNVNGTSRQVTFTFTSIGQHYRIEYFLRKYLFGFLFVQGLSRVDVFSVMILMD